MKTTSLIYMPASHVCQQHWSFPTPFHTASQTPSFVHLHHLALCLGKGNHSINALCHDKHVFSDTVHSDSPYKLARYESETHLFVLLCFHFSDNCQVWSTVPVCNKLHILANSSTISPLSSFKTLGRMPSVPVIYSHLECHSKTSVPPAACSNYQTFLFANTIRKREFSFSFLLVTANARNLP